MVNNIENHVLWRYKEPLERNLADVTLVTPDLYITDRTRERERERKPTQLSSLVRNEASSRWSFKRSS